MLELNIGLASFYFWRQFKDCFIIAVEPEKNNYDTLVKNIKENNLDNK
jgi:FkbM family methyltransferase